GVLGVGRDRDGARRGGLDPGGGDGRRGVGDDAQLPPAHGYPEEAVPTARAVRGGLGRVVGRQRRPPPRGDIGTETRPITVLLADDHALVRESLSTWLRGANDMKVTAEVGSADEAVAVAVREKPDVVLMDIDMPGLLAFDAVRTIRSRCPGTRIIVLSGFFHDRYIEEALSAEASGYITKGESADAVVRAVRAVANGGTYFSPEVQARIVV